MCNWHRLRVGGDFSLIFCLVYLLGKFGIDFNWLVNEVRFLF